MNARETAERTVENVWWRLGFPITRAILILLVGGLVYMERQQNAEIKESIATTNASISRLSDSLTDFKEKQFNPLTNAVTVLQTTIDKGINQALDSQNRRIEVLEHRVDALSDRVNQLSMPQSGAKR